MRHFFAGLFVLLLISACTSSKPLHKILRSQPILKEVSQKKDAYRLQVIYTRMDKDKKGNIEFTDYTFNVDTSLYFYPASTAKLVVSALALERINNEGEGLLTSATPLKAFAIGPCQTSEVGDTSAKYGMPSLGHYIHKMLLVSDNPSYNRVFDFVGQDYAQYRLRELGFEKARIIQRFDPACNSEANREHNRFEFYRPDSTFIMSHTARTTSVYTNPTMNTGVGNGYYYGDSLVHHPREFRYNNNIPLSDIHSTLMRIIVPYTFPDSLQFRLEKPDYRYLKMQLGMYPYESDYPKYDSSYFPAYKKYLFYGRDKNASIDSNLKIYNIVGQAYGFTTDVACFVNTRDNVFFFLSATLYTNADGILNDDKYEYDAIALPFLKALGQEVYKAELKRKRAR
jgi:hypothetical protein